MRRLVPVRRFPAPARIVSESGYGGTCESQISRGKDDVLDIFTGAQGFQAFDNSPTII
ncbi:hypothetical protein L0156_19165 [bacterium]|nr:hypothetical protein [bacterium]